MSDADWKRAQNEPLSGEGEAHFRGKCRLREILQRCGYYSTLEQRYLVHSGSPKDAYHYRADVRGLTPIRCICCEVDGPRGHKTKRAHDKAINKYKTIRQLYGEYIEVYTFHWKRLIGKEAWTDKEIVEEMNITTLDRPNTKWL